MAADCNCRCTPCALAKAGLPGGGHCQRKSVGCNV